MTVYQFVAKLADSMGWPSHNTVPQGARALFGEGIDSVDGYLDDLSPLEIAVEFFRETQSQVLFAAGVAYAVIAAAYQGPHKVETAGLTVAQEWLNRLEGQKEHCPEVWLAQLLIDIHQANTLHSLAHLNKLEASGQLEFHVQLARLHFLCRRRSLDSVEEQYQRLQNLARTNNQHFQVHWRMAQHYLYAVVAFRVLGRYSGEPWRDAVRPYAGKGRVAFEQASRYMGHSPSIWNSFSTLEMESGHLWRAARLNIKSLGLRPSIEATRIKRELRQRLSWLYYLAR